MNDGVNNRLANSLQWHFVAVNSLEPFDLSALGDIGHGEFHCFFRLFIEKTGKFFLINEFNNFRTIEAGAFHAGILKESFSSRKHHSSHRNKALFPLFPDDSQIQEIQPL